MRDGLGGACAHRLGGDLDDARFGGADGDEVLGDFAGGERGEGLEHQGPALKRGLREGRGAAVVEQGIVTADLCAAGQRPATTSEVGDAVLEALR